MEIATQYAILAPQDTDSFAEMLAIYRSSIVPSEQKTAAELAEMLRNPRYKILVAHEGPSTVGFAISFFPACGTFWLLEYMAVDQRMRSQGHGERIFFAAKRLAADVAGNTPCLLEVDQPPHGSAADDEASRRLRFYGRVGCRKVGGLDYILPLDAAGRPPPMWLLVHGLEDQITVPAAEVAQWLETIYADVYGKPAADPRLITMLSSVRAMNTLNMEKLL